MTMVILKFSTKVSINVQWVMSSFSPQVYLNFSGFLWKVFGLYLDIPLGIPSIPEYKNIGTSGKGAADFWSKIILL